MAETIGLVTLTYVGDSDLSRPAFLGHQCQASECPLRKNSLARALASSPVSVHLLSGSQAANPPFEGLALPSYFFPAF